MIFAPHILLVSGGGRNVGKTSYVRNVIAHTASLQQSVVGVKISSHFHVLPADAVILFQSDDAIVIQETQLHSHKDSSLFLQSGASEVLYVQVRNEGMEELLPFLLSYIDHRPCVCESGGLRQYIRPGVHIYFTHSTLTQTIAPADSADVTIIDFDTSQLQVRIHNNKWRLA